MLDKETILEMIGEQEQVVKKAKEQLSKLYILANDMGISIDKNNSVRFEIEKKRKEVVDKIEKLKQNAQKEMERAMSEAEKVSQSSKFMSARPNMNFVEQMKELLNKKQIEGTENEEK